jgi:hypothetical protein
MTLIILNSRGARQSRYNVPARMTETTMPGGSRSYNGERLWRRDPGWQAQGVDKTGAIGPNDHALRSKILHKETKRVKFHRTRIISGEFMNRQKILNNVRSNKDIVKVKGSWENRVAYGGNREDRTVTYNDR